MDNERVVGGIFFEKRGKLTIDISSVGRRDIEMHTGDAGFLSLAFEGTLKGSRRCVILLILNVVQHFLALISRNLHVSDNAVVLLLINVLQQIVKGWHVIEVDTASCQAYNDATIGATKEIRDNRHAGVLELATVPMKSTPEGGNPIHGGFFELGGGSGATNGARGSKFNNSHAGSCVDGQGHRGESANDKFIHGDRAMIIGSSTTERINQSIINFNCCFCA
mmetsp:Transcript_3288/g.7093  ORF Transcript_3288/g.7093 Transcript_3288/m.7093 type:complete len:222 (-) Transcript_3288:54-719(-)